MMNSFPGGTPNLGPVPRHRQRPHLHCRDCATDVPIDDITEAGSLHICGAPLGPCGLCLPPFGEADR